MKKLKMLRNLHRTERALWIMLLVCLFALFELGIDIEYEHISAVFGMYLVDSEVAAGHEFARRLHPLCQIFKNALK